MAIKLRYGHTEVIYEYNKVIIKGDVYDDGEATITIPEDKIAMEATYEDKMMIELVNGTRIYVTDEFIFIMERCNRGNEGAY